MVLYTALLFYSIFQIKSVLISGTVQVQRFYLNYKKKKTCK